MQVEIVLPGTEDDVLPHPIKYGLLNSLKIAPGIDKSQLGCRHCGQDSKPHFIGLNALASHLKSK